MAQPVVATRYYTPVRWILVIIAILLFLLAAFHANPFGNVDLLPLGLAFGFGALLVP